MGQSITEILLYFAFDVKHFRNYTTAFHHVNLTKLSSLRFMAWKYSKMRDIALRANIQNTQHRVTTVASMHML
jgi:hypothetical protein